MKMRKGGLLIVASYLFALFPCALLAQQAEKEKSRVQWANASSAPAMQFMLNRTILSRSWAPGQRSGAGVFPAVNWNARFTPPAPLSAVEASLELQDGDSAAAVLIGDFKEYDEDTPRPSKLPAGFTESSDGKLVRAGIVTVPIGKGRSPQYPIYLLNGIPERTLQVGTEGGGKLELEYGVIQSFRAAPGSDAIVTVEGRNTPVGFEVDNLSRGGLFAFYQLPGKDRIEFVFLRLHSIESYRDRVSASERGRGSTTANEE